VFRCRYQSIYKQTPTLFYDNVGLKFFLYILPITELWLYPAINDACLVYDGKLVIDAYFHTNDVCIRGAGSLTKFQRKYHADKWSHANFNSKEVGIHVRICFLELYSN